MLARGLRRAGCCALIVLATAPAAAGPKAVDTGRSYTKAALEVNGLSLSTDQSIAEAAGSGVPEGHDGQPAVTDATPKHPMVAFLMSAVLPGWGEFNTGHTTRGRAFMSAEAAIWLGYLAFTIQEDMRIHDYEEYASIFADVPEGSDGDYYGDIADYIRSEGADSYNEAVRAEARSLFPDDLDAQREYVEENGYYGSLAWDWGDRDRLDRFRDLRNDAAASRKNAFYMTGLAVLNRAISAIDSAWMARRHNASLDEPPAARLSVAPELTEGGVGGRLALEIQF